MTSPYERPDRQELAELEPMIRALGEELAAWRRRALRAEADLQEVRGRLPEAGQAVVPVDVTRRLAALEQEEAELQRRLALAREHVERLRTRLRFLEERAEGAA
jgi:predicted  nucleic acid-binding Zn-ribbon protein